MTTGRVLTGATNRVIDAIATWSPADLLSRLCALLWPANLTTVQRLIRLLWLPVWIGTDLPAPGFRPSAQAFAGTGKAALRFGALLRSVRRRQLINRAAILVVRAGTLIVAAGCIWSVLGWFGASDLNGRWLLYGSAGALIAALIFAWRYRPDLRETAAMVDRSFQLSDRLTTAYDFAAVDRGDRRGSPHLAWLQVIEATNTLAMLSRHAVLRLRLPTREVVLCAGLAMIFLALHLFNGTGAAIDPVADVRVPVFVSAADRLRQQAPLADPNALPELYRPTVAEVQERADLSASAEQDLLELADALEDNPLTSSIADAIRSGDYERAARELEAIAPSLAQMSPELKDQLADELESASNAMSGDHPGLQDATDQAADGLRSDPETAEASLRDLGQSIEQTGGHVADQQELADQMRDARESEQTGSVEDSDDSRPSGEQGDSSSETTEPGVAGEGSDASSGQKSDDSEGSSESESGSAADSSGAEDGNGSEGGGSGTEAGDNARTSNGGGAAASGQADPSSAESSSSSGGGAFGGDSPQSDDASTGSSADAEAGGGTGAGGGEGEDTSKQSSSGAESKPGSGDDSQPDPNVIDGSGSGSGSANDSLDIPPESSITLSRSPDATGQRTGGASSSSTGSGAGAAAGSGSVEQGDVGAAGPDSNRVPKQYRPIVEDYFSDGP